MTLSSIHLLTKALAEPHTLPQLSLGEWDLLIRQARSADVLARIAEACETGGLWALIPAQPKMHLLSAATVARRQHIELNWEIAKIAEAIAPTGVNFVLLKGAAYVKADLLAAKGRMMSDVDILVDRTMLTEVESALMLNGWKSAAKSDYDQRYYRDQTKPQIDLVGSYTASGLAGTPNPLSSGSATVPANLRGGSIAPPSQRLHLG